MTPRSPVLFVSHSSQLHGAERSLLTLVKALKERGRYDPSVLLSRRGPLLAALEAEGVAVSVLPFFHWIGKRHRPLRAPVSCLLNLASLVRLRRALAGVRPALVYTNTLATPFGALIALVRRVPHVWHVREFVYEDMGAKFDFGRRPSLRFARRCSTRIICNSHAVKRKLSGFVGESRLRVVHNGFPFDGATPSFRDHHERALADGRPVRLVIAGTVHPGKGQEDAIRALPLLRSRGHAIRLEIIGSAAPPEIARLESLAEELGVADALEWTGFVDGIDSRLADAAVALVCSRSEAFGRVAVEAMAAGIPVVAANAGALPEIVSDGKTGLLYPPGDPDALAHAVTRLLTDRALYEKIAQEGWRSVTSSFTVDAYASGVERVIDEALASAHREEVN